VGSPYFLGVFLGFYFLLILLDYVFVMDFVYVHSSPWWYWCGLSAVVLSEQVAYHKIYVIYSSAIRSEITFLDYRKD
jgi:hypothetical protein